MDMKHWPSAAAAALLLLSLGACEQAQSPSEFYKTYYQRSASGFASLDEDARYHSQRKRAEVAEKIPALMQSMGKTREEVIAIYLSLSKAVAHCKKIELTDQQMSRQTAQLTYRQSDACGSIATTPQTQRVRLVNEDGWKIDHVEIAL